ncbi:SRPBCC family protein [Montanilutibacter psychrotolerans]|uniref:SRPBCC family protein n=1 Tax=Montanilutibacter psychrotolerans TaxID=1327343 RepID=A0A3M8SS20_9GAMM|nr:SRPBCC family protein [Lysobacter psychrotolerans]RNF84138.1 SRPBCC family protein [Lysobacter psychrotolerans]
MASIHRELQLDIDPSDAWAAVRDYTAVHRRLVPGVLVDTVAEPDARVVTFANGLVARELIVSLDDARRRLCWAWVGGQASHHNASMQVFAGDDGGTRMVWITDVLPEALAGPVAELVEQGAAAIRRTLRRSTE